MAILTDLTILAFYQVALIVSGIVTLWQTVDWLRSRKLSLLRIGFKSSLRGVLGIYFCKPAIKIVGRLIGAFLLSKSRTEYQRSRILSILREDEEKQGKSKANSGEEDAWEKIQATSLSSVKADREYKGFIGFFHPFCNAGGGGERVLWAAIRATQLKYPNAICVVYTGDHDVERSQILENVKTRFDIKLNTPRIFFMHLSTRRYVLASTWPRFTLLGQSLGSIVLAIEAFTWLVPDMLIDTMGYAFALGCTKFCFPDMPIGAYIHYPTISTDMLSSLNMEEGKGLHAGAGKGLRGFVKRQYWRFFAWCYSWVGGNVDVVMTNSSWTGKHIRELWGSSRKKRGKKSDISVVFPPVAVEEITRIVELNEETEAKRQAILLYIAQFRPEKNHELILKSFSKFLNANPKARDTKLVLVGSVRDSDDKKRVYKLRLLAHELGVKESVEFVCDATWSEILEWLGKSSIGINGMWNEHFGIGVVEYQAAGLISVVNDSGGPKQDIVVDYQGGPTGYHASTPEEYADAFQKALARSPASKLAMRKRARASASRFNEEQFAKRWLVNIEKLVELDRAPKVGPTLEGTRDFSVAAIYSALLAYDILQLLRT